MADPRYASDQHFRNAVIAAMARTEQSLIDGHRPARETRDAENADIVVDEVTTAMSNPLYRSSPAYRRQVELAMGQSMRGNVQVRQLGNPAGCNRVNMDMTASVAPMDAQSITARGDADGSDD